jgi:predicted component of type VI protein secretion system
MSATKERVHTYLVIKGAGPERIIVWDTQDVSLGRASENDISIDDDVLSRKHAVFHREGGGWGIKDLGTSNGTTVNGEAIRTRALANRDVVRIGGIEISFVQVAKNPGALGKPVEFASQLKNFGGAVGQAKDGEATVLGLMQTVGDDDEEFVVGKVNDFSADLDSMQEPASRAVPRDLDLELDGMGGDSLPPPKVAARPAPAAKPAPRLAPAPDDWSLDDVPEAPQPQPQPRAARPQPQARSAPRPAAPVAAPAAAAGRSVSLQLEIEGLTGDLRRLVDSLLDKQLELPPLRIRVKRDDLA